MWIYSNIHCVQRGHPFVLPILVMLHLLRGITCFLNNPLWSCITPHDCEVVGSQVTCPTCLQCLLYSSLKCKISKSVVLPTLEPPLTCSCYGVLCCGLPVYGHKLPYASIWFYFWGTMQHLFCVHTPLILGVHKCPRSETEIGAPPLCFLARWCLEVFLAWCSGVNC